MSEKKSLVEEALLQMQNLEEAIAQNAKGILASTMKQEISELVKESLQEETEDEDETDMEMDVDSEDDDVEMDMDVDSDEDETDMEMDMDSDEDETDMEMDVDSEEDETEMDSDSEEPLDLRGLDDDQLIKVFKSMKDDDGIIVTKEGDNIHLEDTEDEVEYMIDLGESEENEMDESWEESKEMDESWGESEQMEETDIDSIMEKMFQDSDDEEESDEMDEVVYEIHMDDEDDEELDESLDMDDEDDEDEESLEMDDEDDEDMEDEDEDEEDLFESLKKHKKETKESFKKIKPKGVGMGKVKKSVFTQPVKTETKEGSIMTKPKVGKGAAKVGGKNTEVFTQKPGVKKSETKEAARTLGNGKKWGRNGLDKPKSAPRHLAVETEIKALREKNEEYRKALNIFRDKLNEVAVFNSNLAYATRLFTEHSTTKQEKLNILRRFDGVESLKESKSLYKSIKDELASVEKPLVKESIEKKIEKVQSTGSSINLIESKTYENPQFLRMKDLMSKIK